MITSSAYTPHAGASHENINNETQTRHINF